MSEGSDSIEKDLAKNGIFYKEFNKWLESIRVSSE